MRVIVVGHGVQGEKRRAVAGTEVVAVVDPIRPEATHARLEAVPATDYDAALVCTPDEAKPALLRTLLDLGKHVLVEKPLLPGADGDLAALVALARRRGAVCYVAYNHRFEPHFVRVREILRAGTLGTIYSVRLFYGNGTARLVGQSPWRDRGAGILTDLGSHLLDTVLFWFDRLPGPLRLVAAHRFENQAFDHAVVTAAGTPLLQMEMSYLSWRNHFQADILAEHGSLHVDSLCKWGPATLTLRRRVLPAGRPDEERTTLVQADPTWRLEYEHFRTLCRAGTTDLDTDRRIAAALGDLAAQAGVPA